MHDGLKKFFDYHKSDGTKGDKKLLQRVKVDPSVFDSDRPDPLQVRSKLAGASNNYIQVKRSAASIDNLHVKRYAVEFEDPLQTQKNFVSRDPLALKSLDMKLKSVGNESKPIKVVFTSSKNHAFNPHHIDKPNCKPLPNFADPLRKVSAINAGPDEPVQIPVEVIQPQTPSIPVKPKSDKPDAKPFMAKLKTVLDSEQYSTIKEAIRFYKEKKYTQKQVIATFVNSLFDDERRFRKLSERKTRWEMYKAYGEFVSSKYIDYYQDYLQKFKASL